MSETVYLKCKCQHCGNSIEFPEQGLGQTIPCPHCEHPTRLDPPQGGVPRPAAKPSPSPLRPAVPASSSEKPARPARRTTILALAAILILAAGGILGYGQWKKSRNSPSTPTRGSDVPSVSDAKPGTAESLVEESAKTPSQPLAPATEEDTRVKSVGDFKTGSIALSPAKGSSLVYATGSLTNASAHQRFGVRIEIELADAEGRDVGMARDYRPLIDPGGVWNFRALVLHSKAASAHLKRITEEP